MITMRSIGFRDVSERNGKRTQCRGKMVHSGILLSPWAHWITLGRSNQLLPYFGYKRVWEVEGKGISTLGKHISLKISEEKKKEGENQGRGASVTLP